MEALKRQNEDLNTRLLVAEGQTSRRDHEREERCEMKRHERIRRGKH